MRQRKNIFQKQPKVWQNFSEFLYGLGKYSFIGLVVGGFVVKEILIDRVIWGLIFTLGFAIMGFYFDYLTRR